MRRPSPFSFDGPVRSFRPKETREQLGVSKRTLDSYYLLPGFPQGRMERHGRVLMRVMNVDDVVRAQGWLIAHGLPGGRANRARLDRLEDARSVRNRRRDLEQLAGRLAQVAGAAALVNCLHPLNHHARGLNAIPKNEVSQVRLAITRAITLHGGRP